MTCYVDTSILVSALTREAASGNSLAWLAVKRSHFTRAARLADQHALGLRAADALHLAIILDQGLTLYTLDLALAKAAGSVGVRVAAI